MFLIVSLLHLPALLLGAALLASAGENALRGAVLTAQNITQAYHAYFPAVPVWFSDVPMTLENRSLTIFFCAYAAILAGLLGAALLWQRSALFSAALTVPPFCLPLVVTQAAAPVPQLMCLLFWTLLLLTHALRRSSPAQAGRVTWGLLAPALALLLGGAWLLIRKVISWHTPVAYIGTVAILTLIAAPAGISGVDYMLYNVFGGGLMLGAIFMATDYATSPVTKPGQLIFGIGCGLITCFIRRFGSYPEGVCYSILIMNCTTWLLDKYIRPTIYGAPKKEKKEAAAK